MINWNRLHIYIYIYIYICTEYPSINVQINISQLVEVIKKFNKRKYDSESAIKCM